MPETEKPTREQKESRRRDSIAFPKLTDCIDQIVQCIDFGESSKKEVRESILKMLSEKLKEKTATEVTIFCREMQKALLTFFGFEYRSQETMREETRSLIGKLFGTVDGDSPRSIASFAGKEIRELEKASIGPRLKAFQEEVEKLYGRKEKISKSEISAERLQVTDPEIKDYLEKFLNKCEDKKISKVVVLYAVERGLLRKSMDVTNEEKINRLKELMRFARSMTEDHPIEDFYTQEWLEGDDKDMIKHHAGSVPDIAKKNPEYPGLEIFRRNAVIRSHFAIISKKDMEAIVKILAGIGDKSINPGEIRLSIHMGPILKPASIRLVAEVIGAFSMAQRFLDAYDEAPEIMVTSATQSAISNFRLTDADEVKKNASTASVFLRKFGGAFYRELKDRIDIDLLGKEELPKNGKILKQDSDIVRYTVKILETRGMGARDAMAAAKQYWTDQMPRFQDSPYAISFYNAPGMEAAKINKIGIKIFEDIGEVEAYLLASEECDVNIEKIQSVDNIRDEIATKIKGALNSSSPEANAVLRSMSLIAAEIGSEKFIDFLSQQSSIGSDE